MSNRDQDPSQNDAAPDAQSGQTRSQQGNERLPRMPHERDESSDTQQNQNASTSDIGKRAFNDAESESEDTGRAPVTDKVYNDKVRP